MKKNEFKSEFVNVNILDVLLDEKNTAPIYMYNDEGKKIKLEQVAVIPLEEELYCILKPITKVEGVKDNEAVVFRVVQDGDEEAYLDVEQDELVALKVFNAYYNLIEEQN